jgi:DNA-directed RNA polymerase subunit RPC12/RpoP
MGGFSHDGFPFRVKCVLITSKMQNITKDVVLFIIFIGKHVRILVIKCYKTHLSKGDLQMEEAITFWLDNKISSGVTVAKIGSQTMVLYRDKYYVVVNGAAQMKGVRPLHFSKTSMPLVWKKALKGILPPPAAAIEQLEDEFLPTTTSTKKERPVMNKRTISDAEFSSDQPHPVTTAKKPATPKTSPDTTKPVKIVQTTVAATCPYCNHKQELPFEKGKNGKPFFVTCSRCSTEFAVRFVPVTLYQAQVAAFK